MAQGKGNEQILDQRCLITGGAQMFESGRGMVKQTLHRDRSAGRACHGFIGRLFAVFHDNVGGIIAITCVHGQFGNRRNGRQGFPAES